MSAKVKVLFFLHRIGPYHHARFDAVSDLTLIAVETRPDSQEYEWKFNPICNYKVERFPKSENVEVGIRGELLKATVNRLLLQHQPDVVVTTGWADPEYHRVVLEADKRRIALVIISDSRYEDEPRRGYKEWIKKLILKSYTSAIVAGTASRNYLVQLGFSEENIFLPWDVVDNAYFLTQRSNRHINFSDRDFICVSRFIPKKNIERLLQAFALYQKNGGTRRIRLIGSGVLELTYKQLVKQLKIDQFVLFEGFKQYEELPSYLAQGLCLVLPSTSDQWGLVVNEAMASGLPILVSERCGCAADLVKPGVNGYRFDPLKIEEIAEVLIKMDNLNSDKWLEMSKESIREIDNWNLGDFASALQKAVQMALHKELPKGWRVLHSLLSK